ncbi:alpha/beta fold hydrolase [Baaleninema sp.]|uniref:alpha/beta fold hydrolase n=1 Tax=Baaleninema sp. TaxID=3101197 RepID=UPI003D03B046
MLIPPGFEQKSIETSLGRMAYYTATGEMWAIAQSETASPTLVFLHGLGGGSSAYEWSKVYPAFASRYRILAPDLIGWGRSNHPERDYKPEDYIKTIGEFLEQTCEEPVTVIASSLTAAFTIRAAIDRPELFKSLILTNPSGLSDFGNDYKNSFFAQLVKTPILDRLLYTTAIATPGGIQSFLEQRQFAQPKRIYNEIVEAYLESATQPNAEYAALSFVRGDCCFDLARYMPQLTVPTAMLWGKQTQFVSYEVGKRLADQARDAVQQFEVLEDVGLTPQLELPAVTIGIIEGFLQELATNS